MRRRDWPERLSETLEAARTRAFVWGEHDCILNACDAALAVTGVDPAAGLRGRYSTERGGLRVLKRVTGATSIGAAVDQRYPRTVAALARRGDWALAPVGPGGAAVLMVVDGPRLFGPCGETAPRSAALACWRID